MGRTKIAAICLTASLIFGTQVSHADDNMTAAEQLVLELSIAKGYGCGILFAKAGTDHDRLVSLGMPEDSYQFCIKTKRVWDSIGKNGK